MRKKTDQEIAAEKDSIVIIVLVTIATAAFVAFSGVFSLIMQAALFTAMLLSFVIAAMGRKRKIGFTRAFLASSFFSPIIGLIITLSSPRLADEEYKERMLEVAENNASSSSVADQLHKLNELRKEGVLTTNEFEEQKRRLLAI